METRPTMDDLFNGVDVCNNVVSSRSCLVYKERARKRWIEMFMRARSLSLSPSLSLLLVLSFPPSGSAERFFPANFRQIYDVMFLTGLAT